MPNTRIGVALRMTYVSAAIVVLTETRRSMTAREIAEAALRKGLIEPRGRDSRRDYEGSTVL